MGRRGPAPKPSRLKDGKPRDNEPQPTGIPTCPPELNDIAKKEWRRISKDLAECGLLTKVDRAGLAAYCALYARWVEAEAQIRKHGMLIKAPSGYPMQSPYLDIANQCIKQMRGYMQEFGLSPSARTRIDVSAPANVPGRGRKEPPKKARNAPAKDPRSVLKIA